MVKIDNGRIAKELLTRRTQGVKSGNAKELLGTKMLENGSESQIGLEDGSVDSMMVKQRSIYKYQKKY